MNAAGSTSNPTNLVSNASRARCAATDFGSPFNVSRSLGERGIVLRSLREGIDTSNAAGRMVAGVLASLAELELELGKERRAASRDARRARGQSIGRPKALTDERVALARRMHDSGESATTIATTLEVSRASIYRVLAELGESE